LQPAYNRQFALRDALLSRVVLGQKGPLTILCYPQRWDSVSFYHPQADVRVYTREQRRQLLADLRFQPRILLLVKSGKALKELRRDLPYCIQFVPHGRPGLVTAGWIRPIPPQSGGRRSEP
jgi:hypothetical protein